MVTLQPPIDQNRVIAAELLKVVPRLLWAVHGGKIRAGSKVDRCADMDAATDYVVDLLEDCLRRDDSQTRQALAALPGLGSSSLHRHAALAAWDLFYGHLIKKGSAELVRFVRDQSRDQFKTLPMVDQIMDKFPVDPDSPLHRAHILACRHLFASTVTELDAVKKLLGEADFVEVIGKPYSANKQAVLELKERDFYIRPESIEAPQQDNNLGTYLGRHREITRKAVDRYLEDFYTPDRPLLVIDDGGALIDAVGQKVLTGEICCPVVAIEQTSHGSYALNRTFFKPGKSNGFALIRAFESRAKLAYESPLIAASVIREMQAWLAAMRQAGIQVPDQPRFGVIGYGVIGAAVARALTQENQEAVAIYEQSRHKTGTAEVSDLAGIDMAWSVEKLCAYANVIIGATGGTAISPHAASNLRDGTILVSASSGDKEFSGLQGWHVRPVSICSSGHELPPFDNAHGLLVASDGNRTVYIVNRGYPVNFDGSLDPIAPHDIQLTRAVMVGAVIQAVGIIGSHTGSMVGRFGNDHDLDEEIDKFLAARFHGRSASGGDMPAGQPLRRKWGQIVRASLVALVARLLLIKFWQ